VGDILRVVLQIGSLL